MRKLLFLLILGCVTTTGQSMAQDLIIAQRNQACRYQIVIPDHTKNPHFDRFMRQVGSCMQRAIRRATGCNLPVVLESRKIPTRSTIFLGNTRALKQARLPRADQHLWEHRIEVRGRDIYVYGQDIPSDLTKPHSGAYFSFVLGSAKAAAVFLEKFTNTRFVAPGPPGLVVLPQEVVKIPADYSYHRVPQIVFCIGRTHDLMYDMAHNTFYAPWYGCHGGHSHNVAIPPLQYRDKHPEYFALRHGKRTRPGESCPQYCLSNPQVQELIYQELLKHADQGFKMVQLSQSDGFREGCECENCQKMYGVKDWGEKLWIMHSKMAERFQKDRPGKLLNVIAYGPTLQPPRTLKKLPDNVMVDISHFCPDLLDAWKKIGVKAGFSVYLYNWGYYHIQGFTPKCSIAFLQHQVKEFYRGGVQGIYRCGFGELFGLEGGSYYIWGRLLDNPHQDGFKLLAEYCRYAFGPAGASMEKFYRLIDRRLTSENLNYLEEMNFKRLYPKADWNDPDLLAGKASGVRENLIYLIQKYPQAVRDELEKYLQEAEKINPSFPAAKMLLPLVRLEFDYLKYTAQAAEEYQKFCQSKSQADFARVLSALELRNKTIARIPMRKRPHGIFPVPLWRINRFGYARPEDIKAGGRLRGVLHAPYTWNVSWFQQHQVVPSGRVMTTGDAPQYLVAMNYRNTKNFVADKPVKVQYNYDQENFYVDFYFENTTQDALKKDAIQVFIDHGKERYRLSFGVKRGYAVVFRRNVTNEKNKGQGDRYVRDKSIKITGRSIAPVPGSSQVSARLVIPWKIWGVVPRPGDKWGVNAAYYKGPAAYIWEYNLRQQSWRNCQDAIGTVIFK